MILADFRTRFPELSNYNDAMIEFFALDAESEINPNCPNYERMVMYSTAHKLAVSDNGANVSRNIKSESISGFVDVSYAVGDSINPLETTGYGQIFLQLKKQCGAGTVIIV